MQLGVHFVARVGGDYMITKCAMCIFLYVTPGGFVMYIPAEHEQQSGDFTGGYCIVRVLRRVIRQHTYIKDNVCPEARVVKANMARLGSHLK